MTKEALMYSSDIYTFFYGGPFSQWYKSDFISIAVDGKPIKFNCAEQYMMYSKASLFEDKESAAKILRVSDPRTQKLYGREVKGYNDDVWMKHAPNIVYNGNYLKFTQNERLLKALLETKGTLVEASPYDNRWGIGLSEDTAQKTDPSKWPGKNLLGQILTRLRKNLEN